MHVQKVAKRITGMKETRRLKEEKEGEKDMTERKKGRKKGRKEGKAEMPKTLSPSRSQMPSRTRVCNLACPVRLSI